MTTNGVLSVFVVLAVAIALAMNAVGYVSGTPPEWAVFKSSIGLLMVCLIGWVISSLMSPSLDGRPDDVEERNVSAASSDNEPADSGVNSKSTTGAAMG